MNVDAKTLFQIVGEKEVELYLLRQQMNQAIQVLAETKQALKGMEETAKAKAAEEPAKVVVKKPRKLKVVPAPREVVVAPV